MTVGPSTQGEAAGRLSCSAYSVSPSFHRSAWWVFGSEPLPVTVTTIRLTQSGGDAASVLDASGYVVARRQATVSSQIAGKVLEVLVEEGVMVQRDGHA